MPATAKAAGMQIFKPLVLYSDVTRIYVSSGLLVSWA